MQAVFRSQQPEDNAKQDQRNQIIPGLRMHKHLARQSSWKQSGLVRSKHKSICGHCISRVNSTGRMQSKCKCVTVAMIWHKLSYWYKRNRGSMRILMLALMPTHFTGQLFKLQGGKVLFRGTRVVSNTTKRWS